MPSVAVVPQAVENPFLPDILTAQTQHEQYGVKFFSWQRVGISMLFSSHISSIVLLGCTWMVLLFSVMVIMI